MSRDFWERKKTKFYQPPAEPQGDPLSSNAPLPAQKPVYAAPADQIDGEPSLPVSHIETKSEFVINERLRRWIKVMGVTTRDAAKLLRVDKGDVVRWKTNLRAAPNWLLPRMIDAWKDQQKRIKSQ